MNIYIIRVYDRTRFVFFVPYLQRHIYIKKGLEPAAQTEMLLISVLCYITFYVYSFNTYFTWREWVNTKFVNWQKSNVDLEQFQILFKIDPDSVKQTFQISHFIRLVNLTL